MERRTSDAAVADAMNRVLAAESEAAAAIATAQSEAEALIEAARSRRRQILDTARRRTSRLHARAQARLQATLLELEGATAGPGADTEALRALSRKALANIVRRLTAAEHEPG
jgi:hypothetical protein